MTLKVMQVLDKDVSVHVLLEKLCFKTFEINVLIITVCIQCPKFAYI